MANTLTLDAFPSGSEITSSQRILNGTVALSGNASAGGEVLNFLSLNVGVGTPSSVKVWSEGASGYIYQFKASTGALFVMVQGAAATDPLAPLTSGAYPAGVTGDVIRFEAKFAKA